MLSSGGLESVSLLVSSAETVTMSGGATTGATADALAGSFFGFSLFPWLLMLYWLGHSKVGAPKGVVFGLQFLLVFVFGSIPAAIGAGSVYGDSLADVDWLHGAAESLLAVTNCVVVFGFRDALRGEAASESKKNNLAKIAVSAGVAFGVVTTLAHLGLGLTQEHTPWLGADVRLDSEPANALSLATWSIHTSSLVEWLVAMGLCWKLGEEQSPQYKGLTWGMLPLHSSGIIACSYHLLYNASAVTWLVTLQAMMTCLGNSTMAFAAYRLATAKGWTFTEDARTDFAAFLQNFSSKGSSSSKEPLAAFFPTTTAIKEDQPVLAFEFNEDLKVLPGWEDLGEEWAADDDRAFFAKLVFVSLASAAAVKYVPPLLPADLSDTFFASNLALNGAAISLVLLPTCLNILKWQRRSSQDTTKTTTLL